MIKQVEDGMIKLIPLYTMQKCAVINFTSDNKPSVTKRSTFIIHWWKIHVDLTNNYSPCPRKLKKLVGSTTTIGQTIGGHIQGGTIQ